MHYHDVEYQLGAADTLLRQREHGVFLCTRNSRGEKNVMTIGWGSVTTIWAQPLFLVLVRPSRHTFSLIQENGEFTICVPPKGEFKEALALCGTKSGRDMDKFKAAGLTIEEGTTIKAPRIMGAEWIYECQAVYRQPMDPGALDSRIIPRYYGGGDFHTIYYGEILSAQMKA